MTRNIHAAATLIKHATPGWLESVSAHDPDMIRDVAAAYLAAQSPSLALAHGDLIADLRTAHEHWTLHGYPEGSGTLFKIAADALESPSLALADSNGYWHDCTANPVMPPEPCHEQHEEKFVSELRLRAGQHTEFRQMLLKAAELISDASSRSVALAEENRVLREALDRLIKATTNLLIHVDTSTCGGALLTFYHEAKSAKDQARAAISTPSPHPHSKREEAFEVLKKLAGGLALAAKEHMALNDRLDGFASAGLEIAIEEYTVWAGESK